MPKIDLNSTTLVPTGVHDKFGPDRSSGLAVKRGQTDTQTIFFNRYRLDYAFFFSFFTSVAIPVWEIVKC